MRWIGVLAAVALGVMMASGCGSAANKPVAQGAASRGSATATAPATGSGAAGPHPVATDLSVLWRDYKQLLQDMQSGKTAVIQADLGPSSQQSRDYAAAMADLKAAGSGSGATGSRFADFLTRYGKFRATVAKAVKAGTGGDFKTEQADLLDAANQEVSIAADYEAIIGQ